MVPPLAWEIPRKDKMKKHLLIIATLDTKGSRLFKK